MWTGFQLYCSNCNMWKRKRNENILNENILNEFWLYIKSFYLELYLQLYYYLELYLELSLELYFELFLVEKAV